jgi:hypothetical protein
VILEILADAEALGDERDAVLPQQRACADPGQLEKLRRVDGAPASTTSRRARSIRVSPPRRYSTPTALRPSKTTRVAMASVTTWRFGRRSAGRR